MKAFTANISGNEVRQSVDFNAVSALCALSRVLDLIMAYFTLMKVDRMAKGLGNPQLGAYHSISAQWFASYQLGTVVLPAGTGRYETMLAEFISERFDKRCIIVTSGPLRSQISVRYTSLGRLRQLTFLPKQVASPLVETMRRCLRR